MAVDVSAVVADVAAQAAPVVAVGLAVLLVFVGLHAFRWLRSVAVGDGGSGSSMSPAQLRAMHARFAAEGGVAAPGGGGGSSEESAGSSSGVVTVLNASGSVETFDRFKAYEAAIEDGCSHAEAMARTDEAERDFRLSAPDWK